MTYGTQKTLSSPIRFSGKGLHTGKQVSMTVLPAPAGSGIVFRRTDLEGRPEIPASAAAVTDTSRGTKIESGSAAVFTVEHIMSALWNMGVDNAVVEIDGPEVPIMDGSAREYVSAISQTGLMDQGEPVRVFRPTRSHTFSIPDKGVEILVEPADTFSVSVSVDYASKVLGAQQASFAWGDDYAGQIAPCRTFVFLHEIAPLLKANLIKGGDLENAIVVVEHEMPQEEQEHLRRVFNRPDIEVRNGYLNNLKLRFPNEIARHKLLDILGDLALVGRRLSARITAVRPGHLANTRTAAILQQDMAEND